MDFSCRSFKKMVRVLSILVVFLASSTIATGFSTPSLLHYKISSSLRATAEDSSSFSNGATGTHDLLTNFLVDMKGVGAVRFVVVGAGAILETIGSFDNLRFADTTKGRLATLSNDSPCFECHIRLNEVQEVKNVIVEKFEKKLRITRFLSKIKSRLSTHYLIFLSRKRDS